MSGKEDKRQRSMLNYFGVQAEAGVVLPVVSTPDPQSIVELQPNAVLQCLHEQPPDKNPGYAYGLIRVMHEKLFSTNIEYNSRK